MEIYEFNGRKFWEQERLGRGKDGYSYLVIDEQGHPYVLKVMHERFANSPSPKEKLQESLRCYEILCTLSIAIPRLLEVDEAKAWMLKQYIPGPTVAACLKEDALPKDVWDQMSEMAKTANQAGWNLDYTPSNYIIDPKGKLYYIDYDCSSYLEAANFENCGRWDWEILRTVQTKSSS